MRLYRILNDCFCEGYLHELLRHYREDIEVKKLLKYDIVEYIDKWSNMYGSYIRVSKDGIIYDMLDKNLGYVK